MRKWRAAPCPRGYSAPAAALAFPEEGGCRALSQLPRGPGRPSLSVALGSPMVHHTQEETGAPPTVACTVSLSPCVSLTRNAYPSLSAEQWHSGDALEWSLATGHVSPLVPEHWLLMPTKSRAVGAGGSAESEPAGPLHAAEGKRGVGRQQTGQHRFKSPVQLKDPTPMVSASLREACLARQSSLRAAQRRRLSAPLHESS